MRLIETTLLRTSPTTSPSPEATLSAIATAATRSVHARCVQRWWLRAHACGCTCGARQFGYFSGQLGDGAAILLGEVHNAAGERWQMQIKGCGPTPFSRGNDGRKVLRSSVREFLCSEAMHALGIPTTRAGALVTSDTRVVRDKFYDGNAEEERASIVLRLSPTFIRYTVNPCFSLRVRLTHARLCVRVALAACVCVWLWLWLRVRVLYGVPVSGRSRYSRARMKTRDERGRLTGTPSYATS